MIVIRIHFIFTPHRVHAYFPIKNSIYWGYVEVKGLARDLAALISIAWTRTQVLWPLLSTLLLFHVLSMMEHSGLGQRGTNAIYCSQSLHFCGSMWKVHMTHMQYRLILDSRDSGFPSSRLFSVFHGSLPVLNTLNPCWYEAGIHIQTIFGSCFL